jgi:hypothetical protein
MSAVLRLLVPCFAAACMLGLQLNSIDNGVQQRIRRLCRLYLINHLSLCAFITIS